MQLSNPEISSNFNTMKNFKRILATIDNRLENFSLSSDFEDWMKILKFFNNDVVQDFNEMEPEIMGLLLEKFQNNEDVSEFMTEKRNEYTLPSKNNIPYNYTRGNHGTFYI